MADVTIPAQRTDGYSAWSQLKSNRNWLGYWYMLPALLILGLFLAYPLGLGVWLSFTDTRIGRPGEFIGFILRVMSRHGMHDLAARAS